MNTVDSPNPMRIVGGLLLLVPAAIALLISYIIPTFWTLRTSTMRSNLLTESSSVGLENYERIGGEMPGAFGYALAAGILPLLTVIVFAGALAAAAHFAGRTGRWATRLVFALPMVSFAPTALAAAWYLDRLEPGDLSSPNQARVGVAIAFWLTTFGLTCGLAVTAYLAALRRREQGVATWPALITVGGLAVIATIAVALQMFTFPSVMTGGGPNRATQTPMVFAFQDAFEGFNFGVGAAAASLLLIVLAVLGILATLLVILTRLRIEVDASSRSADEPAGWTPGRIVGTVLVAGGLAMALVLALYGLWPWLSHLGDTEARGISTGKVLFNTWVPSLVSTVVGVFLAALGGFGIGALRPVGRFSEVLLLPFAPWLFVGFGPLALANFDRARDLDLANTFFGVIPPSGLCIPALFLFTLLARGQERRWRELRASGVGGGAAFWRAALPGLPMVVIVGFATWVFQAQDLVWSYISAGGRDWWTGPVVVFSHLIQFAIRGVETPIGLALPIPAVVVLAIGLAVAQLTYLDRVAIRTGDR